MGGPRGCARRSGTRAGTLVIGALALAVWAVRAAPAGAHAVLVRSVPASRAVLSYPPDRVRLWFSERLEPAFSTVSVWTESGAQVDRQDMSVGPDDAKQLSVSLQALEPGIYTVRFRVLSVDGHIVEATFPFTVKPRP